jgi:RHS repeat-associated protein
MTGVLYLRDHLYWEGLVIAPNSLPTQRTVLGYDAMGHIVGESQCVNGTCNVNQYGYDLAGDVINLTYPDGRQVAQTFDAVGRLAIVNDATTAGTATSYISGGSGSSISYTPTGAAQNFTLGNGVTQANSFNNRLQPCHTMVTTPVLAANINGANLLDRESFYSPGSSSNCSNEANNNGNIYAIVDNLNVGWTQGFGYDNLNRLVSANRSDGGYNHSYNIDSFGNMIVQDNLHGNPAWSIDPATNRLLLAGAAYSYDASGNLVQTPTNTYEFDAESRLASVDLGNIALYTYDADGERIRKDVAPFNNQAFTEYTYFNGQPLAEKDQNGNWTDYIYANGAKIAKVVSQVPTFHMHGYRDGTDTSCGAEGPVVGSPADNLQIVAGDQFVFDFQQTLPSYGGLGFIFTDGTGTGAMVDSGGTSQPLYFDGESDGAWHHMVGDLSPYVGETVAYPLVGLHEYMPLGTFDMYYANAEVLHANGSVTPIVPAQVAYVNGVYGTSCGGQNMTSATELTPTTDPNIDTTYYLDDHLSTTQMELSAGGWPLWVGQFMPFGGELADGTTAMHYKFTGKERDTESGLDYFGARYYGSNMGRFMSPDWSAKAQAVPYAKMDNPQTLNLYQYMRNNPLSGADPDGHCDWCQKLWNGISGNGFQTNAQIAAMNAPPPITTTVTETETYTPMSNLQLGPGMTEAIEAEKSNSLVDLATSAVGLISATPGVVPGTPGLALGLGAGGASSVNDTSGLNLTINGTGAALGVASAIGEGTAVGTAATVGGFGVAVGATAWSFSNFASGIITSVFTPPPEAMNINGTTVQQPDLSDIPH